MSLLILFLKAPLKGQVKTRLAKSLGPYKALAIYRACIKVSARRFSDLAHLWVAYTPEGSLQLFLPLLPSPSPLFVLQQGEHLGKRMKNAFAHAFDQGHSKVLLVGGDVPDLPAPLIQEAFCALDQSDAVFVPTKDGGYCLVGASPSTDLSALFNTHTWSHSGVMAETLERARLNKMGIQMLSFWEDLDTLETCKAFVHRQKNVPEYAELCQLIKGDGDGLRDDAHGCADEDEAPRP